ncbi:TonB-linked outer membrane protein, SusC/RagA family [Chryseobacterium taklimakanense]|uniref:TonB-linked outer membrane protein, SusC/RagA family n=1 Tax=Chryseobacterium taklimakanense TaxID=536441 RepID=A0A239X7Y0_9FLAO|nr:carboxypeptidase-like regulatory domain-containing protein [Chryseobacterium taklimakanense]SNV42777.1 TonB-linked outer membrane protein, SusC/RagA family [Chryseobacterium taklimakanense]
MKRILLLTLFFSCVVIFAQNIPGKVVTDGEVPLSSVLIINMRTGQKTYTDGEGNFSIEALPKDELRFVKAGYERSAVTISSAESRVYAHLRQAYHNIEEVKLNAVKLSGDLNRDSKLLAREDKTAQLKKNIGLPASPEKPREKPAELVDDVLKPLAFGVLNIQGVYDIISGDARRKKHLYELEDQQSDVYWIRKRVSDDYFTNAGVPQRRIPEFIEFSFTENPKIRQLVKVRNLSGVLVEMEESFPVYILRLKQ